MKIAIVHDSLVEFGGAERVLATILSMYPRAHVYTGFYNPLFIQKFFPTLSSARLHATWIQKIPLLWSHTSLFQSMAPFVWHSVDLSDFDLVISHTLQLMCNMVRVAPAACHIQYLQSPPKNILGIDPPTPWQRLTHYERVMKPSYKRTLMKSPYIITNSRHTKDVLRKFCGVAAAILYPSIAIPQHLPRRNASPSYYLIVSRLDRTKNIETAITACNHLRVRLKIAGKTNEPRYERYLRSIAGPTIEFLGFVDDRRITSLYTHAIGLIFPSYNEDFGMVPLEANAHGVPVIAYWGGGTKETVIEGKTGIFFHQPSVSSLEEAIQRLSRMRFDPRVLRNHAKKFDDNQFERTLTRYINKALAKKSIVH